MKALGRSGIAVGIFLIGCVTGGAAAQYVETASAQEEPRANAVAWEYSCFGHDKVNPIQERANLLGDKGWELAASGGGDSNPIWCFKRRR